MRAIFCVPLFGSGCYFCVFLCWVRCSNFGRKETLRGFIVGNNGRLFNRIGVDNTGGTTITVVPTTVLTSSIMEVRGVPGVSSISLVVGVLSRVNTSVGIMGGSAVRVSAHILRYHPIPCRFTSRFETDCCLVNTVLNEFGGTSITLPNNYSFNSEPVSRRVGNFEVLNTSIGVMGNVMDTRTRGLINASVCVSIISINTAVGIVLTTILTEKLAIVRGTTGRPRVISLTGFLGSVNTSIEKTNASIVGVHNIRGLRNYACSIVPSRVRTNACVITTTTYNNSILIGGIVPGRLRSVDTGLRRTNTRVVRCSSTIHMAHFGPLAGYGIGAVPRPNFPASVRPRVTILLTVTGNASVLSRSI